VRYRPDPCVAHLSDWVAWQGRELIPDFSEAERFLRALDPGASAFSFRTFSDSPYTRLPGRDPLEHAIHGSLEACWERLVALNRQGAAISVTINQTNGQGRRTPDIIRVRALFLDDDNPIQSADRFPLTPQIQVSTSPGHYHHYWLVEDLPLESFTRLQRELARCFGGDGKVLALNQSMQLPGIWRRKSLSGIRLPKIYNISIIGKYSKKTLEEELLAIALPV
jgi:hypothetical protein